MSLFSLSVSTVVFSWSHCPTCVYKINLNTIALAVTSQCFLPRPLMVVLTIHHTANKGKRVVVTSPLFAMVRAYLT